MRSLGFAVLAFVLALPAFGWRTSAWVPAWDANAVTLMQAHGGKLDEANPGWYTMAANGSIVKNWNAEDPAMRAALTGTTLVPTIKNIINDSFNGAAVATLLASPANRELHAENLALLVVQNAFDGIDIDYERVPTTSRADFTAFIELLAQKLHASGKLLSVTVVAKASDSEDWNGPGSQDWIAIGRAADSVKIMCYDYHWSTSAAGPLTPLDWLDKVAVYAEQTLPVGKAIIGLPWYGYDWLGKVGATVTYAQAMATAKAKGATVTRDANGELTYTYDGRTVYFQDATSYRTKVEKIASRRSGIAGFAHWRVGAEDPALWGYVAELKAVGGAAPARSPVADFAIDGPTRLSVAAGAQQTTQLRITRINGFDAPVTIIARMLDPLYGAVTFGSNRIAADGSTTMTVAAFSPAPAGTYRVELTMTGGSVTRMQVVEVEVRRTARTRAVR